MKKNLKEYMGTRESALMRNLPGMAYKIINDGNWSIEYVSQGCIKLFGEEPFRIINEKPTVFANLIHKERFSHIVKEMEKAMKERKPYKLVYRINSFNEKDKWVWDQGEGIYSNDGRLLAAVGFMTDFTEHKEMENQLKKEIFRLRKEKSPSSRFPEIIGNSPAMERTFELIEQCAASHENIIVTGESGTGKELVSRAIHKNSPRRDNPFVPVNCGAIPENLLESEFFGSCKGAFSGASSDREGILDRADKGTLFLDEIGEIPLSLQTKLLRAIEGGGYTAVGGSKFKKPDIRIIAATNRDLLELVKSGKMREDFYYRINVVPVHVPPLRERKEDIPLLISHFISLKQNAPFPNKAEIEKMERYGWPGNIRELQNIINRFAITGEVDIQEKRGNFDQPSLKNESSLKDLMRDFEREIILKGLKKYNLNRTKTASMLGIDRRTLYSKIREYKIPMD